MFTLIPAFKYGWQEMQKKLWVFLLLTLLISSVDIGGNIILKDMNISEILTMENAMNMLPPNFMLLMGLLMLVMVCINFFVVTFVLAGLRGIQPMTYLRMKIKRFPLYFVAMLLKYLAIGAGLALFIIPGLFLLLALYFVEYLIIDRDMSIIEAFKTSWNMTKGFRTGIFFFEVNLFIIGYILSFPQSLWPDTTLTYAILVLINVAWLPVSWNAQGWIYQFVSEGQIDR
ncbi:MAG: hypothetical protein K9N05_00150 [Candidatus Marinimicrobia bacterium]|nr:hypothetical protein [Candidatus Neomarinimicrobiota bacterium]